MSGKGNISSSSIMERVQFSKIVSKKLNDLNIQKKDAMKSITGTSTIDTSFDYPNHRPGAFEATSRLKIITAQIESIRATIRRYNNNTFGICIVCGRQIGTERLLASIDAQTCTACANKEGM